MREFASYAMDAVICVLYAVLIIAAVPVFTRAAKDFRELLNDIRNGIYRKSNTRR